MAGAVAKGTILVTGANGGLGTAIVEQIVLKPELSAYHGVYTVRNTTHAPALTSALSHGAGHSHDIVGLDLTKLDTVRQAAEWINVSLPSLMACHQQTLSFPSCYDAGVSNIDMGT